jgi:hypothetical protein
MWAPPIRRIAEPAQFFLLFTWLLQKTNSHSW